MVFRVKLLTLTMTGILLMGVIPLAVTAMRRGQLREEMMEELNTLGRSECEKVAKDVYLMLRAQHETLKKEARHNLNVAEYILAGAGGLSLSDEHVSWTAINQSSGQSLEVRLLKPFVGSHSITQNTDPAVPSPVVDKVRELVGGRCTIFQRMNDSGDLLRVCTNVLKKDGTRAIGTYIPAIEPDGSANPVVAAVLRGETYVGRAYVVNHWYLTAYEPIFDSEHRVIGALFCGVRLEGIPELRNGIVDITVGRTGYAYVLGGSGEQKGRYIISQRGLRDGENIYDSQDAAGRFFIRSIIEEAVQTKDGECRFATYAWRNPGEDSPRSKVVATTYFEPWDWVIGVGAYEDDFQAAIARVDQAASRLIYWGALGAFMAFVLCGVLAWVESGRIAAMNHEIAERRLAEARQGRMLRRLEALNQLQKDMLLPITLADKLRKITDCAVALFDLDLCRIWQTGPGDLCSNGCIHATAPDDRDVCLRRDACLHLMASSGRYTPIDGDHRRVPFGCNTIGRIASGEENKFLTNDVAADPRIHNHEWAKDLGLVSSAGYKLRDTRGDPIGVLAMFAKHALSEEDDAFLSSLAEATSGVIAESNAEEAIRTSEAKYKTLYDASSDAIMYTQPEAGMLAGNPATIRLFGCRDETEFVSLSPADLSPEFQPDGTRSSVKAQEMMAIAMERGSHFFEWQHRRMDGSEFPATILLTRMTLEGRTVLLATTRDITAQKGSERALRESERRLASIIDFLPDATFAIDREGKVIAWNRAIEEMTGVPADQMLGKGDCDYAMPFYGEARPVLVNLIFSDNKDIEKHYCSVVRKGTQLIAESRSTRLRGDVDKHLWVIAAPLYDSEGHLIGAIESIRDITEQTRAKKSLEESQRRLAAIIDFLPDGALAIDHEGKVIAWNHAIEQLTGTPASEMLGKGDYAYAIPLCGKAQPILIDLALGGHEDQRKNYASFEQKGSLLFAEQYLPNLRQGKGAYLWGFATPLYDGEGHVVGAIELLRDITEKKQAEDALRASETKYRTVYDASIDGILLLTTDQRIVTANRAAIAMFGCRDDSELIATPSSEFYPARQPDGSLSSEKADHILEIVRREGSHSFEWSYHRKDGVPFHATVALTMMHLDNQEYLLFTIRDITETKRAEEALRASETRYKTLYDASADAITIRTPDRRIIAANKAAVAMFGYQDENELVSAAPDDFYPEYQPNGRRSVDESVKAIALAMREGPTFLEWRYKRRDGTEFDALVSLSPMDIEGKCLILVTARDITKQKRAEEAVHASEVKYRTLYDASSDAILLRTPDRRILSGNRAAVALFGCKDEEELLAMTPADLYSERQPDGQLASEKAPRMAEIALRDGSYSFEWKYRRKDGSEFLADVLWTRMELEGQPILLTTIRDITKQRQAEEALHASERVLRLFAENVNDVTWAMDFNNRFTYMSPSVHQLLGYTPEEALQLTLDHTLTPPSVAVAQPILDQIRVDAQRGQRIQGGTLELEQIRKDGSTVMTEVSYSGMYDESGNLVAIQGVGRDITARKQVEEERTLATQRMESLLALSHMTDKPMDETIATVVEDAICMTRSTLGYLALMNEDESVLTMRYWSRSAHADCRVSNKPIVYPLETTGLWGEAVRQRQPVITNDYAAPSPLKRGVPEGHVPIIRHMNIPVFDGRRIVAVAGVANKATDYDGRDLQQLQLLMEGWWRIAMQKQFELNLAQARDDAQAANRAKSRFLATMSHEIRTPMTAILGYAELLMDPSIDLSTRNNYAATIRRSGEHLLSLINDILDLSKIEAGKMSLSIEPCRLVPLLADVASVVRPRAQQHHISFSVEYEGAIPETIHTDRVRLRQTIVNLAGNAVKFTEKGSVRVVVSFLPDGCNGQPALQIDVIDTGIGISEDILPQLFRPFSQGDPSVARLFGGTGLGLAISRQLAHLLGGTLSVASKLGQGSTFTLTIPTGNLAGVPMLQHPVEAMQEDHEKAWSTELNNLTGVRILLAEDGFDNRELIQAVLQRAGAEVDTAVNGRIAVQKARETPFDLILMDMNMPEMDGYEATRVLRDHGHTGPIVALTANAMVGDSEHCREVGCDEYLAKPIDRTLLIRTIASLVDTTAVAARTVPLREADGPLLDFAAQVPDETRQPRPSAHEPGQAPAASPGVSLAQEPGIVSEYMDDPQMAPIIRQFVGRLAEQLDAMHQSLANHAHHELRRQAHKLKGAGGSYGYQQLTDVSKILEDAAAAQNDAAEIAALATVAVLVQAIERGLSTDEES